MANVLGTNGNDFLESPYDEVNQISALAGDDTIDLFKNKDASLR
jgi:hypothetical protein